MTAMIRPLLLAVAFWATAPVISQAAEDAGYIIDLRLDPADGTLQGTVTIENPAGDVALPRANWLHPEELRLGDRRIDLPENGTVSHAVISGRPVSLSFQGALPDLDGTPRTTGTDPAGSFLIGASWLPLDDTARQRFRVSLNVPATHRAVATGTQTAITQVDGRSIAQFAFDGPAHDLGLFAGPYVISENQRNGIALRTYFEPSDTGLSDSYMDAASDYLARYAQQIGPYPYDSFSVVSAPIPVGLGFAGLTYVSRSILHHPYMRGRSLAHEVLHSWWGNAVGVDYDSGNWAEGLTTYQADHALAEAAGGDAAREMRLEWLEALTDLPDGAKTPLRQFRSSAHDGRQAVGYGKAALMFHMLRAEIGEAAFETGISRFYTAHKDRIAAWPDLQAAFAQTAQRDLSWFFDQWLDRPDLPRITLGTVDRTGDRAVRVALQQAGSIYRLRVPVQIETSQGTETRMIHLDGPSATLDITTAGTPGKVLVDPGYEVARQLLPGETAPRLADVFMTTAPVRLRVTSAPGFAEASDRLIGRLFGATGLEFGDRADLGTSDAAVLIGETRAIADMRDRLIPDPRPWPVDTGAARAWAERDAAGTTILFISADAPADLGDALSKLRYFGPRSFVAFDEGAEQISAGKWDVTDSPLVRVLD